MGFHSKILSLVEQIPHNEDALCEALKKLIKRKEADAHYANYDPIPLCSISDRIDYGFDSKPDRDSYFPTGFDPIDTWMKGFRRENLVLITGTRNYADRLLINLALNVSRDEKVLFFSFDWDKVALADRMYRSIVQRHPNENSYELMRNDYDGWTGHFFHPEVDNYPVYIHAANPFHAEAVLHEISYRADNDEFRVFFINGPEILFCAEPPAMRTLLVNDFYRKLKELCLRKSIVVVMSNNRHNLDHTREPDPSFFNIGHIEKEGCDHLPIDTIFAFCRAPEKLWNHKIAQLRILKHRRPYPYDSIFLYDCEEDAFVRDLEEGDPSELIFSRPGYKCDSRIYPNWLTLRDSVFPF